MILKDEFQCAEVPESIAYSLLRPAEHSEEGLPFLYVHHGGRGSRDFLERVAPMIERAWAEGALPPLIAVTPTIPDYALHMNLHDGSERWEDALAGSFLGHMHDAYGASRERRLTMTCGPSAGGAGSLHLAFKRPDVFGAVAALSPGIQPVLDYADIQPRDIFWRSRESFERAFGSPIDPTYWRANNPTSIAHDSPSRLRDTGLEIFIDCGDEDSFGIHRGVEFLHRVLFDNGIHHEYRLVRGADHLGPTFPGRFRDALAFLGRYLVPPPPDPAASEFRAQVERMKRAANVT